MIFVIINEKLNDVIHNYKNHNILILRIYFIFISKKNLCIVLFLDKSSQQLLEPAHDKLHGSLTLNNSEMIHRNARGSCHELSEVTSKLLHATAS